MYVHIVEILYVPCTSTFSTVADPQIKLVLQGIFVEHYQGNAYYASASRSSYENALQGLLLIGKRTGSTSSRKLYRTPREIEQVFL